MSRERPASLNQSRCATDNNEQSPQVLPTNSTLPGRAQLHNVLKSIQNKTKSMIKQKVDYIPPVSLSPRERSNSSAKNRAKYDAGLGFNRKYCINKLFKKATGVPLDQYKKEKEYRQGGSQTKRVNSGANSLKRAARSSPKASQNNQIQHQPLRMKTLSQDRTNICPPEDEG
jgi:hypothetical protein